MSGTYKVSGTFKDCIIFCMLPHPLVISSVAGTGYGAEETTLLINKTIE